MKKLLFTLCLMVACMGSLMAGPVDQQKAQRLGSQFLSATALGQRGAVELNLVSAALDRDAADYYVFNVVDGEGFVVVAADDRVKPILAYSTTGHFDPANVSEGFAFTLNAFREEIQYVREHNLVATPDIKAEWASVMATGNLQQGRHNRSVVGPLCQTLWNQNYPWSSQCPEDPEGSGGHVYAGCVATAMGQVMKFWDWPAQGQGSHSYNPQGYGQQSANFGETEYHFELMPNVLDSTSTDEEVFHVAQLLHHLGISVDMQYSGHGSGAYSDDVPRALRNYFLYNCDDHITNYNYWGWGGYTNEEWIDMLKEGGLDEGLPLYYSGSDEDGNGGHAFVCDGYDENDYFHYNWGWSGRDDAWCPIGALNTTKYAFNVMNGFTGHIVPQDGEYYSRPDSVSNMAAVEQASYDAVHLSWTNPTLDLNGNDLTEISSVTLRRNFEVIATFDDAVVGAEMEYDDENLEPGLYEYAIFVTNEAGISRTTYRTIMVGEKCNVVFQLHDEGGDGWKGAAISVTNESGQRIAIITMNEGSELLVDMPLLKGNLNLIWNHGWYHTSEEYDTDYECSFSVFDSFGNELYVSDTLADGIFLTFDNNCEEAPLICYPVQNLEGEYYYTDGENLGGHLTWTRPTVTEQLDHFNIYRILITNKTVGDLIATVPYDGSEDFEYFDNMAGDWMGGYQYEVTSAYVRGEDECESEPEETIILITDLEENTAEVSLYPNPTNGLLHIEGQGAMHISVSNLLGQQLMETNAEGDATLDLSRYEAGFYLVRVATDYGVMVQKVNVRK